MMLHTSGLPQFAQVAECSKVRPPTPSTVCVLLLYAAVYADNALIVGGGQVIEIRDGAEGFTEEIVNAKLLA